MTTTAAGDFLVAAAERLAPGSDPALIRAVLDRACGGRLSELDAVGRRASGLTVTGIPFEASVTGGRGRFTPTVRYATEAGTAHADFGSRIAAQRAAIDDISGSMPNNGADVRDTLQSFVTTLYPNPAAVPSDRGFATWLGVVHHAALPDHIGGIKLYGNLRGDRNALPRLCAAWPGFAELLSQFDDGMFVEPRSAAIEIDAAGVVGKKVYLKARFDDIATPMKLVRCFGDPAWQAISELVHAGVDAAALHRFHIFVCCGLRGSSRTFALYLSQPREQDMTPLVRELAVRHHGSTATVDALDQAAHTTGANLHYSVVGLGFSPDRGIDKLNIYCAPDWKAA